jgi:nitroimidazol reductase NimA-like FMN-containing flavoprotein (pyridoxamine 5'-phosphate oxidase superfamily)
MQKYHFNNRPDREITDKSEISMILKNGKFCTVSLCRDNEPYIVTLSYGYELDTDSLYFHCSDKGLKLDFIKANQVVCATVIEDGGYIKDECGHNYRSVVFWGIMEIVKDIEEKRLGMQVLLDHLEKKTEVKKEKLTKSENIYSKMNVLRLRITQIHGKAGR